MALSDRELQQALRSKVVEMWIEFGRRYANMTAVEAARRHSKITILDEVAEEGFMLFSAEAPASPLRSVNATRALPAAKHASKRIASAKSHGHPPLEFQRKTTKFRDLTQPDAILRAAAENPDMTTREIAQYVAENGLPFTTKNIMASVTTAVGKLNREGKLKGTKTKRGNGNAKVLTYRVSLPLMKIARA